MYHEQNKRKFIQSPAAVPRLCKTEAHLRITADVAMSFPAHISFSPLSLPPFSLHMLCWVIGLLPKRAERLGFGICAVEVHWQGPLAQEGKQSAQKGEKGVSWASKGLTLRDGAPEHSWTMGMVYRTFSGKVRTIQSRLCFVQDSGINLPQNYCRESCDWSEQPFYCHLLQAPEWQTPCCICVGSDAGYFALLPFFRRRW